MDSKELSEHVGKKINYYRKKTGITQKDLGDKIGVKHNTISDYELGKISPEQDMLFAISNALNISVDDLFPQKERKTDELERALKITKDLNIKDMDFLSQLIEKTLTLEGEDREKFLESIKFTVEYHDKMNKE